MIGTLTELKLERTQKKMVKSVDSKKGLEEKCRRMDKHSVEQHSDSVFCKAVIVLF